MVTRELKNVIQLGVGFLLIFTAFQSCSNIQEYVIQNIASQRNATQGSLDVEAGYYSLAIIYGVLTIFNFVAPFVVSNISSKWSMVLGSVTYIVFLVSFLCLSNWLFYMTSALLGIGAALIWVGQGSYLTENSDEDTVGRNSGLFWAILQCSLPLGGLFVYVQLKSEGPTAALSQRTIDFIFGGFTGLAALGALVLLLLPRSANRIAASDGEYTENRSILTERTSNDEIVISAEHLSHQVDSVSRPPQVEPAHSLVSTLFGQIGQVCSLAGTRPMIFLAFVFVYTGLELTFWSSVYGTAVANTLMFSTPSKQLLALNTIFIGLGEILGGGLFGVLGTKFNKFGRNPVILTATVVHLVAFFLILMNIPAESPQKSTSGIAYMQPNEYLALLCSSLIGFGDACWNTQIYSLLASLYANNSAPAFGLFKFFQSGAACLAFFGGAHLLLHWQLLAMAVLAPLSAIAFFDIEWKAQAAAADLHEKHP